MSVAGAAAAVGISAGSAIAQGIGARNANRANKQAAALANSNNIDNWHRQNAYNDPSAQMARLQKAGLNPRLIYGASSGGAAGTAGSTPSFTTQNYQSETEGAKAFENIAGDTAQFQQVSNIKAQEENTKAGTILTNLKSEEQTRDTDVKKNLQHFNDDIMREMRDQSIYSTMKLGFEKDMTFETWKHRAKNEIAKLSINQSNAGIASFKASLAKKGLTVSDPKIIRMLVQSGIAEPLLKKLTGKNYSQLLKLLN